MCLVLSSFGHYMDYPRNQLSADPMPLNPRDDREFTVYLIVFTERRIHSCNSESFRLFLYLLNDKTNFLPQLILFS